MPEYKDSIDIIKLDNENCIISIRYGNKASTETVNIPWQTIKTITIDQDEVIIYHNGSLSKFAIGVEVHAMDID